MVKAAGTEVNKTAVFHRNLHHVKTMLIRLRHISYELCWFLDGLRWFFDDFGYKGKKLGYESCSIILLPCYKTMLNRKESPIKT